MDAPQPSALPASRLTVGVTTDSTQSPKSKKDLQQEKVVSPRGRPPPRVVAPRLAFPAQPSGVEETSRTPRGEASDGTAALEEELREKKGG